MQKLRICIIFVPPNEAAGPGNPVLRASKPNAQAKNDFISSALCSLSEKRVRSVVGFPGPRSNFKGLFYCNNMEDWQKSLDRYLTTEPDSGFTEYFEAVCDALHRDVQRWDERYGHSPTESLQFTEIVDKCHTWGMSTADCAAIIRSAFSLFVRFPAGDSVPVTRSVTPEYLYDPNGPTGHGDICHSDADPGL